MQFAHGTDAATKCCQLLLLIRPLPSVYIALSTYVDIDVIHVMKWTRPFPSDFAYRIKANEIVLPLRSYKKTSQADLISILFCSLDSNCSLVRTYICMYCWSCLGMSICGIT